MTGIRKNIWQHLANRIFRREYVAEHARSGVAYQIKAMRDARGWSQADLAKKADKSQSNIARLEDPDYGKFSIQTLLELADAFDVWLSVQFVSFREGLRRTENLTPNALNVISYSEEKTNDLNPQTVTSSAARIDIIRTSGVSPADPRRQFGSQYYSQDSSRHIESPRNDEDRKFRTETIASLQSTESPTDVAEIIHV